MDLPGGKHGGVLSGGDADYGREVRRMQKESMKEKLEKYGRETISNSEYGRQKYEWVFGAVDFACNAGLISAEEYRALLKELCMPE